MVNVIVQRYSEMDDGMGGVEYGWEEIGQISGVLDQLDGDEVLASDKLGELSSHIFIIFKMEDVKRGDRFIINDEIYNVTNVDNPNNLNRQLEIKLKYTGERYG